MKQYNRIKTFYKINSHYPTDSGSLSWISQQQLRYNDLSPARRFLLRAIRFKQETRRNLRQEMRQQHWADQLQKLKSFYTRHRRLPARSDDSSLHSWLFHLRAAVKAKSLVEN